MSRKYALFVGNSEYDSESLCNLASPIADVHDLANVFRDSSIGGFDEVTELINSTESQIRQKISSFFLRKKPEDLLLLYFSGHGVLDDRGHLYLAVKDTNPDLLRATAISADFIADDMDLCRSKRQILILDCCHSGAFRRGIKGGNKALTAATFEGNGSGRIVLTASDRREFAMEGNQVLEQAQTSLFTHFLLEGIKSGEADRDGDSLITLDEWYDYAYEKVVDSLPSQTPRRWVYNQEGRLIIARNPKPLTPVELPRELREAIQDQRPSIRLGVIPELGYIATGNDKRLALAAREALEDMRNDENASVVTAAKKAIVGYEAESPKIQPPEERSSDFSSKPEPGKQEKKIDWALDSVNMWNLGWVSFTNKTVKKLMFGAVMAAIILISSMLLVLPDRSTPEDSSTEQAEVGTMGDLGTSSTEIEPKRDGQESSLPNEQQDRGKQGAVIQEESSSIRDQPKGNQGTSLKRGTSIPQEQEPPEENRQPGMVEQTPSGTESAEKDPQNQLLGVANEQNAATNEGESADEVAAATEMLPIDRVRAEITDLQNALQKAILEREWEGVPAPLTDYYRKYMDDLYDKFDVTEVESKAGELLTDDATATLPVALDIGYRQKGREDINTLQFPAVNWVWIKRDQGFVLSYVQKP